jgi:catechol 2,3-dioxygenase-like lactoylglutathione lyase family enzyme
MRIDHVGLGAANLEAVRAFYETTSVPPARSM